LALLPLLATTGRPVLLRKRHIESGYVEYPACFAAALHLERQLCGLDRSDGLTIRKNVLLRLEMNFAIG
jgi:hypothetical protein